MKEFHILNLGAGVQSTTVFLAMRDGLLTVPPETVAIFADTQEEPAAVYQHLEWLKSLEWPPILVRSLRKLGDDLLGLGEKVEYVSIPAYTGTSKAFGLARRNCSRDFKGRVIQRAIRQEIIGLPPKRGIPRNVTVHQYFGISRDEARRAVNIKERIEQHRGWVTHFPLLEIGWTRGDCLRFLKDRVPHQVPRSACVFCPYHSDEEWRTIRSKPEEWARAIQIDRGLRDKATLTRRGLREPLYLHSSRKPLEEIDLDSQSSFPTFVKECEGVCGV
jgi:hypothetical protein